MSFRFLFRCREIGLWWLTLSVRHVIGAPVIHRNVRVSGRVSRNAGSQKVCVGLMKCSIIPGVCFTASFLLDNKLKDLFAKNCLLQWTDTADQTQTLVSK